MTQNTELIIKDTHRALWYENGVLVKVLGAGRHTFPKKPFWAFVTRVKTQYEYRLVDVRERDLTIKGQEILTADKVAIRVSIIVQFKVTDPTAALHAVENYEDRLYSDIQLAARRSLAAMTLEDILTNRNHLSEDIGAEVTSIAAGYGVAILRADVKDLVFPGNLQEIMNRVLAAERNAQAQLVEARTKAELSQIAAVANAETQRLESEARAAVTRQEAESAAAAARIQAEADVQALRQREAAASAYATHPALMRLQELETMRELARNATARLYIGIDKAITRDTDI